jgi:hypothetical protein
VGGEIFPIVFISLLTVSTRCTAKWNDLDAGGGRRSHKLTEALYEALEKKELWDEYGIIDGIMVCLTSNWM